MGGCGWPGWKLLAASALICTTMAQVADAQSAVNPTRDDNAATTTAAIEDRGRPQANGAPSVSFAAYDVVSVKAVDPNAQMRMMGVQYTPDGIHTGGPLSIVIRVAYGGFGQLPTDDSVTGLPDWARTQSFTIDAKMSPEQVAEFNKLDKDAKEAARETMLQALLADRFQLKIHRNPKQVPDYELVVAKGGPKLKEGAAPDPNGPKDKDGKPIAGSFLMMRKNGQIEAQQLGIESLTNFLGQGALGVGRMVKDRTGLTGKYNFTLTWSPDPGIGSSTMDGGVRVAPSAADDSAPSIFTALEEQLGLKLVPGTGTIDVVVVDHVEKPTQD